MQRSIIFILATAAASAGCGDNSGSDPGAIAWRDCPFAIVASELAAGLPTPQCGELAVPLRNDEPDGESISVAVRRYRGDGARKGQVWYLEGGPGGTGLGMETDDVLPFLIDAGWDFYVPIHRGLVGSTPLECPSARDPASEEGAVIEPSEMAACGSQLEAEWGEDLAAFNADEQAHDVARLVAAAREPGQRVAVWGTSYGSYRAQKILDHYPNGEVADMFIIDAVLDLGADPWNDSVYGDAAALPIFVAACEADPTCAARTSGDPELFARETLDSLDRGDCALLAGIPRQTLQYALTELASVRLVHAFVFPLIDRVARCTEESVSQALMAGETLAALTDIVEQARQLSVRGDHTDFINELLYANVSCRDLHRLEHTTAEILERDKQLVFSRDEAATLNEVCPSWPTYRDEAITGERSATTSPVLIVQGGLDFPTPDRWAREAALAYPSSQFVFLPTAGHAAFDRGGASNSAEAGQCLYDLLLGYLEDPSRPVDGEACASQVDSIDISGTSLTAMQIAAALFGGPLWIADN